MSDEVLCAIIGAVVGAAASWVVALFTLRFNYKELFASTVSGNRMDWINAWRENVATVLATARILHSGNNRDDENGNTMLEHIKAKEAVLLRLNMDESNHVLMFRALKDLDVTAEDTVFNGMCEHIENLTREILKPEWERVKSEAKGKR